MVKKQIDEITEMDEAAKRHKKALTTLNISHERLTDMLERLKNTIIETSIKDKLDSSDKETQDKAWQLFELLLELAHEKIELGNQVQEANREYLQLRIDEDELKELIKLKRQLDEAKTREYVKCINSEIVKAISTVITTKPKKKTKEGIPANEITRTNINTKKETTVTCAFNNGALLQEGICIFRYSFMKYRKNSSQIIFTIDEYMKERGLTSKHKTAKSITREAKKLAGIQIQIKGKTDYGVFNPFSEIWYKNNVIKIELSPTAQKIFEIATAHEYIPTGILRIDTQAHPHTVPLIMKLSELKAMNHGKARDDIHKVKELIKDTELPDYQTVKARMGRRYKDKIINPFERDMNASKDILTWEYLEGSGASWNEFKEAKVKITWNNHPQDKPKEIANEAKPQNGTPPVCKVVPLRYAKR